MQEEKALILYSWNVNGYRAVKTKGFWDWFKAADADVVGIQETKVAPSQLNGDDAPPEGFKAVWNESKGKKGYSGTACFYKPEPVAVSTGLPDERYQGEGRLIRLEYPGFHYFNIYFPNGQKDEERLAYKMGYYDAFLEYAQELRKTKPIVVCGDFNTAHKEIDLARPAQNSDRSGFLPMEREWLDKFVAAGYVDTFRMFEDGGERYTWWTYRFGARGKNVGWRIDYFFVSEEIKGAVKRAWIEPEVMGSDHCPIGIELAV